MYSSQQGDGLVSRNRESVRTLLLVRHAQTKWNSEGRFQGHLDSPVTIEGLAQIEAVAQRLAGEDIDTVFTSDLGRSILTADRIARAARVPVKVDVRLRERDHGLFEGLTPAIAQSRHPEWVERSKMNHDPDFAVPSAESKTQILRRMLPAMVDAVEGPGDGSVVVVGHGGIINVFLNYAAGQPLGSRRNVVPNCSVSVVEYALGEWKPQTIGDSNHLLVLA
jgi:probable phosphoglycerate mutase